MRKLSTDEFGRRSAGETLSWRAISDIADNGKEFARHKEIAKELDAQFYFVCQYHSWERSANENSNGLIRQYIPKGTDFCKLINEMFAEIEWKLNPQAPLVSGLQGAIDYCNLLLNLYF